MRTFHDVFYFFFCLRYQAFGIQCKKGLIVEIFGKLELPIKCVQLKKNMFFLRFKGYCID